MKEYIDPFYMEAADDDPEFESWLAANSDPDFEPRSNRTFIKSINDIPEEELPF